MSLPEEFLELARRVNNWGRWGNDDEIGTLNLITPDLVRTAASLVHFGRRISLAIPLSEEGPQTGAVPGRINPERTMHSVNEPVGDPSQIRVSDDAVRMGLQAATHWDSLAHVTYDGRMYNGFPPETIDESGATRCGIDKVRTLVGRGVLLDVARARGVDRIEGAIPLTGDDLDAAAEFARVEVGPGDIVLIRTGQIRLLKDGDRKAYTRPAAGPSMQSVAWFRDHDVAAVATDNMTFEVFPGERKDCILPVHLLNLVEVGLTQGQNFDLEELSEDCAADGVYEFFLEASPLPFVRGLGSPVNPVAIK